MKGMNQNAIKKANLPSLDREYSFAEIATVTRAATARALGLKEKGHLGEGADGDVAVYRVNPKEVDPSNDYRAVRKAMRRAAYVIKEGQMVVRDGEVVSTIGGRTFWIDARAPDTIEEARCQAEISKRFQEYYTVQADNYVIAEDYLARSAPISPGGLRR